MNDRVVVVHENPPRQTIVRETDRVVVSDEAPGVVVTQSEPPGVVHTHDTDHVVIQDVGRQGPPGSGSGGAVELYDSLTVPASPTFPYLRFERDVDGDVQQILIGTST